MKPHGLCHVKGLVVKLLMVGPWVDEGRRAMCLGSSWVALVAGIQVRDKVFLANRIDRR